MDKIVLVYNVQDMERRRRIFKSVRKLGISASYVEKKDYLRPVGTLAGVKLFLTVEQEYGGPELDGPMLLMAGLDGEDVDSVLKALRESGTGSIPCKAVLTDSNQFWTSLMLYQELEREHRAFSEGR